RHIVGAYNRADGVPRYILQRVEKALNYYGSKGTRRKRKDF
ncbi:10769_t:CDS:1, partial [Scutellospora calospora]